MERTPINLWGPYAYLVGAGDQWGSIYHLMNETPPGTPAKTVYIQYTLSYQPGANATNSRRSSPLHGHHRLRQLDLRRAGRRRAGSIHTKSRTWRAPERNGGLLGGPPP